MPLVRWNLTDPTDASSYDFDMNPNAGGSPQLQKNLIFTKTTGPSGAAVIMEGREEVKRMSVSGVLKEQSHYEALETWYNKKTQIQLTDDLNRVFMIYIIGFTPQRQRSALYPWKHSYTLDYVILDW